MPRIEVQARETERKVAKGHNDLVSYFIAIQLTPGLPPNRLLKVTGYTFSRVKRALNILHYIIQTFFLMIIVLYSYEKLQWELQVKR